MRHIPNILTSFRFILVGFFIYAFVNQAYLWALGIYALAFITDLLDGYLARRNNWISDIGKVLDPLADKVMLIAALVCFSTIGWIPVALVIVVAVKELLMVLGGLFFYKKKNVVVYADWYGKTATGLFTIGVAATLLANFWTWIRPWNIVIIGIAAVFAIIAMIHYATKKYPEEQMQPQKEEQEN